VPNVEYTPHDSDVTCTVVAPRTGKMIKNRLRCIWKRRQFAI